MSPRGDATKLALFEATLELASTRGLNGVTVDEIAAHAEVAKGSVYYNFASKTGLVEALLRYGVDLLARRLRAARDTPDPAAGLSSLVDGALGFIEEYPGFAQILAGELWRTPGQWQQTLTLFRGEIISELAEALRRVDEVMGLPTHVRIPTAAQALFGTVLVVGLDWRVFQPHQPREEIHESIMTLARGIMAN